MGWESAGKAWGTRAWDWALLQESVNANSFDVLQQLTGVGAGVRYLDLACGSGLALQRAQARGAECFGVDASEALLSVAAQRAPSVSLHCGDMADLPYDDNSFDVVTSVNGIMYGSGEVLGEVDRVLCSGGRFGMAFWHDAGDYDSYFEAIAACSPPSSHKTTALRMSDPGVAETLVADAGLEVLERGEHEAVGLYRSLADACVALESAGPVGPALDNSGPEVVRAAFRKAVQPFVDLSTGHVRMLATMGHLVARKP